jgi:hypothetical protein
MTECGNPRRHTVTIRLTSGDVLTIRHGDPADIAAVLPCCDYIVNGPGGAALGALISENDTGESPWDAFDAHGDFIGEFHDIVSGAVAAWNAGPGEGDEGDAAVCGYSARHYSARVPAATVLECGPVGIVPACQACTAFYERNSQPPCI